MRLSSHGAWELNCWSQTGEAPEVLSGCRKQELVSCAIRTPEAQTREAQYPLEVGEQHRHRRGGSERCVVERGKVLLCGACRGFPDLLGLPLAAWNRSLLFGVGRDQAGVDRKPVGADQALGDAALRHALEQPTQRIALTKASMSVLREVE